MIGEKATEILSAMRSAGPANTDRGRTYGLHPHLVAVMCLGKIKYPTRDDASIHLARLLRRSPLRKGAKISVYHCPVCRDFHFGHETGTVKRRD